MVRFAGLLWSLASTTSICTCTHQVSEADLHGEQRADPASKVRVASRRVRYVKKFGNSAITVLMKTSCSSNLTHSSCWRDRDVNW
jgi:hypothetical protein